MPDYHVQYGDTLSAIAQKHQISIDAIQAQNPIIQNPDHIQVGWRLTIPTNGQPEKSVSSQNGSIAKGSMPSAKTSDNDCSTETSATPCQTRLTDVIHVTGASDDQWCMAIPEAVADALNAEILEIDSLMAEFKTAQNQKSDDSGKVDTRKRDWMIKAAEKGVIAPADDEEEEAPPKASEIASKIAAIDGQIRWYDEYDPDYFFAYFSDEDEKRESILTKAKQQRLEQLRSDRRALQQQLNPEQKNEKGVRGTGIKAGDFSQRSNSREVGLVEIMVFSKPGRWYYVRKSVFNRIVAGYASIQYIKKTKNVSAALESQSGTAMQLLGKIREDLKSDAQKSAIGDIEIKFAEAKDEHYLLGQEHTSFKWSTGNGETPAETNFQMSAEAQLMRFAMQASAGVNAFDLSKGEIDVGVKASASMSLAEAEAKLVEMSIPNDAGWDCRFTYKNRNGELSDLAFGAFKLTGDVTLNCFAGGRLSGQANARVTSGSAAFLLSDRKSVVPSPEAGLAVSGNAFAGAEAGGAIAGKFQWVHPDEQFKKNPNWQELLKIEAGGTVAAGIGAGLDFQLKLSGPKVIFIGKGRLVFGPGASGSFGTTVGADTIWNFLITIVDVLEESEFQFISNINPELFHQWSRSLFLGLSSDVEDIKGILSDSFSFLAAWEGRKNRKSAAEQLAKNIKLQARKSGSLGLIEYNGIPFHKLPPETLGMVLHTLTEEFFESREEDQETAILIVISSIKQWRHFFETLQHMTFNGEKTKALESLEKICALLDDDGDTNQLGQFQEWIMSSLSRTPKFTEQELAWQKIPIRQKNLRITQKLDNLRHRNMA